MTDEGRGVAYEDAAAWGEERARLLHRWHGPVGVGMNPLGAAVDFDPIEGSPRPVGYPWALPSDAAAAAMAVAEHRDAIVRMRHELLRESPVGELVIVCPLREVGPGAFGARFYGMRIVPEHSATEWRVVREIRP